jgi:hypothetical protein
MSAHARVAGTTVWVDRWVAFYTAGLPAETASERRAEICSDLHEETSTAAALVKTGAEVVRSIRSRAIRGVVHDLLWRDGDRRTTEQLSWLLYTAAAILTAIGSVAAVRASINRSIYAQPDASIPISATSVIAFIALGLLLHTNSRAAGVGLLAISHGR